MKLIYTLIILFCFKTCVGQDDVVFETQEVFIKKEDNKKLKSDFIKKDSIFYEDDNYIVTRTCSGEWGGSIFFESKKNGVKYSCSATCPISVNLMNGKYIITNSLPHLSGSSEIIEIKDPEQMSILKIPKPRKIENGIEHYYAGDRESKSRKGVKEIWGDFGTLILTSFKFKKKIYHIASKNGKTFLATIIKGELKKIIPLSEENIWDYEPKTFKDEKGNLTVFFDNQTNNGYIEIIGNKINVVFIK